MATLLRFIVDRFLLLPLGAVIALVWANTAGESYFRTAHALAFPVNEIGMAFFLALMTQEHEQVLTTAWPVAVAVDVAAGYYILKVIKPHHGAIPFMLLVAFGIDALVVAVMTFWPSGLELTFASGALMLVAMALALILRLRHVVAFWLVNAGVLLTAYDTGTWAVIAAALVGRPVGILVAVAVAVLVGWRLPHPMTWRDLKAPLMAPAPVAAVTDPDTGPQEVRTATRVPIAVETFRGPRRR